MDVAEVRRDRDVDRVRIQPACGSLRTLGIRAGECQTGREQHRERALQHRQSSTSSSPVPLDS